VFILHTRAICSNCEALEFRKHGFDVIIIDFYITFFLSDHNLRDPYLAVKIRFFFIERYSKVLPQNETEYFKY